MFHLLFPGQGSQHPGMGRFLYENFPIAKHTFEEASDCLNLDLKKLCFYGSEADLALTENTQPCLLVVSTATERVLFSQLGVKAVAASGHSLGEYSAVVAAGGLTFPEAVKAVRQRGRSMQAAVPVGQGGMIAVMGLDPEQVETLCRWAVETSKTGPLSAANYNSPGQIIISGSQTTLDWLKLNFKLEDIFPGAKRVKLVSLQVSAPFHCEMMRPAEEHMRSLLESLPFHEVQVPVLQNFTAQDHTSPREIRENLIRQITAPVRWMQSMELARAKSWTTCIECGAGRVLSGLLKKIDSEAFQVFNTTSLEELKNIEKFVQEKRP